MRSVAEFPNPVAHLVQRVVAPIFHAEEKHIVRTLLDDGLLLAFGAAIRGYGLFHRFSLLTQSFKPFSNEAFPVWRSTNRQIFRQINLHAHHIAALQVCGYAFRKQGASSELPSRRSWLLRVVF